VGVDQPIKVDEDKNMEADNRKPLDLTRIAQYCVYEKTEGKSDSACFRYFNDLAKDDAIKSIQQIVKSRPMSREEEDSLAKQVNDLAGNGGAWIVGEDSLPCLVPRG
jgi:hypothetical protein